METRSREPRSDEERSDDQGSDDSHPDEKSSDESRSRPRSAWKWARDHKFRSIAIALVVLLTPVWWSLGNALANPALGSSIGGRLAEWFREHGGASIVVWAENTWYSHHPPPVGGKPAKGAIPSGTHTHPQQSRSSSSATSVVVPPHLPSPDPVPPIASPAAPGEGQWQPAGRTVDGLPAVYETYMRPDAVHTSVVVGVAWMDTDLLGATLYSGSMIPGGGPWQYTAPVGPQAATSLVSAFNSGFLMSNANGGYYSDGKTAYPLRDGAASFVIYDNGTATVGEWGRDAVMAPDVESVRQNLDLIVDGGQPVPGLDANDTSKWGYTLGNQVYVWRSGVGVTSDGALVYAGGPNLNITDLAAVLAQAGAVRAMELDINTDWVNFSTYASSDPTASASAANGTTLLPGMSGTASRYFEPWWSRDFITMSVRPGLPG
ncbi:MAG TPA: phosphodiester glycosidase family protein [Acidimicrobiales bacterium]|nr:phosphodiester glycosidase family protein [Acidimicrobiales bacterium]